MGLYAYVAGDPVNKSDPDGKVGIGVAVEGWVATGGNTAYGSTTLGILLSRDGKIEVGVVTVSSGNGFGVGGGVTAGATVFAGSVSGLANTNVTGVAGIGEAGLSVSGKAPTNKEGKPTINGGNVKAVAGSVSASQMGKASLGATAGAAVVDTSNSKATTVSASPIKALVKAVTDFVNPALPKW